MARRSSPAWGEFVTPVLLLPALLIGGGSTLGVTNDGWLSSFAIAPIVALLAAHFLKVRPIEKSAWPLLALVAGVFVLAITQLYWTSEGLWWDDASRANARAGLELAGITANGPISLTPDDTRMFLLRWLYPLAILLAVAGSDARERQRTIALIGILGIVAAVLTVSQYLFPELLPYRSDTGAGLGWFANPNHHGLFLACGAVAALMALPMPHSKHRRATGFELSRPLILLAATILAIGMGVLLTGSRAALPLFMIGIALAFLARPHASARPTWFTSGLIGFPVILTLALLVPRYVELAFTGPALADDRRWAALPTIMEGAWQALPWGTGFGSFDRVYLGIEPIELLGDRALNEAHNEIAQWLLEGGIVGIALLIAFLALLWTRGRARLRRRDAGDVQQRRAGAVIILLVAVHSLIDYPTRTVALGTLAMAALALWLVPSTEKPPKEFGLRHTAICLMAGLLTIPAAFIIREPFELRAGAALSSLDGRGAAIGARNSALLGDRHLGLAFGALNRAPLEVAAYEALALATPDIDRSNAFIDAGLALSKRSGILPSLKFQRSLAAGNSNDAVEQALTLLRREEPDANFLTAVRLAALDDDFASGLAPALETDRHWVTPLFAIDADALPQETTGVRRLLLRLPSIDGGPPPHLVEPTLARLIDLGKLEEASDLYRNAYPNRSALAEGDYPNARARNDNTRFDWRFSSVPSFRAAVRGGRIELSSRGRTKGPVAWRFLALEQGTYRLSVDVTGSGDREAIVPEIMCASGSLLSQPSPAGRRTRILEFQVDEGCPLALIRLRAVETPQSYRVALDEWRLERFPRR